MKFEIIENPVNTPEGDRMRLDLIYNTETSFNCVFRIDGKMVAFARGEKTGEGLRFSMLRGFKDRIVKPEDLKGCEVEVMSRTLNIVLKNLTLDNLTRNASMGNLGVSQRIF